MHINLNLRKARELGIALTLATTLILAGCGGSSSGHSPAPNNSTGGTTQVSCTASGGTWNATTSTCQSAATGGAAVPAAPTGLTATVVSASQINLSWTAVANATSYYVLNNTTGAGGYPTTPTWNVTGLTASTAYSFTVYAINNQGSSPASATVMATTTAALVGLANGNGIVTTIAGSAGACLWPFGNPAICSVDGTVAAARFNNPGGITVDATGVLYVADSGNSTIRKITPAGVVTTIAGSALVVGSLDGTGAAARFNGSVGIAVDAAGVLYVADTWNNTIRKITPAGVVTTIAGTAGTWGSLDGTGAAAQFNAPKGIAVDAAGVLYVADSGNRTIRKITPAGVVATIAGAPGPAGNLDGTGAAAQFSTPEGIAVDAAGVLYVADSGSSTIRKITPAGVVTTIAGVPGFAGPAAATFNCPAGIVVDATGNLYVADTINHTIRKITAAGVVTTIAGMAGRNGGSLDGTGAAAWFNNPGSITVDAAGNLYVADTWNHTIRKIQ